MNNYILNSLLFADNVNYYIGQFREQLGFGRWLKEYERMDESGAFSVSYIKTQYPKVVNGTYTKGFIYSQAVRFIGLQAYDDSKLFISINTFKLVNTDGSDYADEDGDLANGLSFDEAIDMYNAINDIDQYVYIADETGRIIYNH